MRFARCAVRVAQNLERIGDSGCHIAKRLRLLRADGVAAAPFDIDALTAVARISVHDALDAFMDPTVELAERACQREPEMDAHFVALLMQLRARMQAAPDEVPYLLHVHSVMKYLEKVGDYVLNIGEQALFLATGRRMKFEQFQQLDRFLAKS